MADQNDYEQEQNVHDYDQIKRAVDLGIEEILPADFVNELIDGANPIYAWRTYRQLTQQQVAKAARISIKSLSQIETDIHLASLDELIRIARALQVSVDDLI